MSDATDRLLDFLAQFDSRVQAAAGGDWSRPAPCDDWTARDVVVHVANNMLNLTAGLSGSEPQPIGDDEDTVAGWNRALEAARTVFPTADTSQNVPGPMGPMPADMLIGRLAAMDTLVHIWDLARATGGDERLDVEAVEHAYSGIKPMDAMIRRPGVFGPKIESAPGADLQTEFLNFLGRVV
ncbi:MAG: hypothetical protein RJB65_1682 [Actinomycetota bacterium]|jgi:uncharacterized protein (TIGR03086 family)